MELNYRQKGAGQMVYLEDFESIIMAHTDRVLTASPIYFSRSAPKVDPRMVSWYIGQGYDDDTALKLTNDLRPRPVYLLRSGIDNGVALMFGEPGATDEDPVNSAWFRSTIARPRSKFMQRLSSGSEQAGEFPGNSVSVREFLWNAGTNAKISETYTGHFSGATAHSASLDLWESRTLLGGVSVIFMFAMHGGYKFGDFNAPVSMRAVTVPSSPVTPCGVSSFIRNTYNKVNGNSIVDGAVTNAEGNEAIFPYSGLDHIKGLGEGGKTVNSWRQDVSGFQNAGSYFSSAYQKMTGEAGEAGVGSYYPFPFTSKLIGYAAGLPPNAGTIVWDGTVKRKESALGSPIVDFTVERALVFINGKQYRLMYPIESIPAEKRDLIQDDLAELGDDVQFCVGLFPNGLNYGNIMYDETVLARDIYRADGQLNDLLFDNVDPSKPPVGYGSLGGISLNVIAKGRNTTTAIALVGDGDPLSSIALIIFKREEGTIVAMQGGYGIDSGEAMVAIRSGAPTEVQGVTLAQVAAEFFALPSWNDVLTFGADSYERAEYMMEEAVLTNELTFDFTTDDEMARAIPLLFGFERTDFALTVGSVAYGVTPHVRIPS